MTRDQRFIELALKAKLLTQAQLDDCEKLRALLAENGFTLSLPEIAARKEMLNPEQLRLINVSIRYEEMRTDDVELGAFIVGKGFLPAEKVNECLALQETPYKEGRHFPRLEGLLVEKNYLNPQLLHVIRRAREQLDGAVPAGQRPPGSSPRIPPTRPAVPPPAQLEDVLRRVAPPTPAPAPPKKEPPAAGAPDWRALEAGLRMGNLTVGLRKAKAADDLVVHILDLEGSLDGHTSKSFDGYVHDLIGARAVRLVVDCGSLQYISSAGFGAISGAVKRCRDAGGDLRFCNVPEKIRKIMTFVGLQALVRSYDSERGAVMSFKYG